ncbi:MAG: hypothetical protein ACRDIY_09585 [Chloroflexota bacterium]
MFGISLHRLTVAAVGALAGVALLGGAALAWSGQVEGRPASFEAGGTDGYYVWHGPDGFHLRTTDSSGVYKYTGELHTNGVFTSVDPVRLEKDDQIAVVDGGHTIKYSFVTAEGIDGVDFRIDGGTHLGLWLDRDGRRIDSSNVFLGEDVVHPPSNPFRIHRTPDHAHPWVSSPGSIPPTATPVGS